MPASRRTFLGALPLAALTAGLVSSCADRSGTTAVPTGGGTAAPGGTATASASPSVSPSASPSAASSPSASASGTPLQAEAATARGHWISGVVGTSAASFARWRGSPVGILGMYADESVRAQAEQWQFTRSSFTGDVDLAVGGPIDRSWARAADGSEIARWTATARRLKVNRSCRTLYLRFAHEANGDWMPWSVGTGEVAAFREAFRRFATVMRRELAGRRVRIVFAPNFGTWPYPPDALWPGDDVVDVVGVSMYEWADYGTPAAWTTFTTSAIGADTWLAFAARHGKPLALSEWGARSPYFLSRMNAWIAEHAGTTAGHLLYDVYMNKEQFVLEGALATRYRSLDWGS